MIFKFKWKMTWRIFCMTLWHLHSRKTRKYWWQFFSQNVPISPIDNFHYEESVLNWKDVYHKRIDFERELLKKALTIEEVVELLEDVIVKDNEIPMIIQIYVDDMLVIEFPTHRKYEQDALVNYEVNIKLFHTSDSKTDVEEDVMDICTLQG